MSPGLIASLSERVNESASSLVRFSHPSVLLRPDSLKAEQCVHPGERLSGEIRQVRIDVAVGLAARIWVDDCLVEADVLRELHEVRLRRDRLLDPPPLGDLRSADAAELTEDCQDAPPPGLLRNHHCIRMEITSSLPGPVRNHRSVL